MTQYKFDELVSRTSTDQELRAKLLANPRATLAEHGIEVPEGIELLVLESSKEVVHLPLFPYVGDQLSTEQLEAVAGGAQKMTMAQLTKTLLD